jgi:transposase-like protein
LTSKPRKQYTREFKQEEVWLVEKEKYRVKEAARSLGNNRNMLDR